MHEAAVLVAHVDVVRLDVAVQVARLVHHGESVEQRRQQRHDGRLGYVLALLAPGLERLAALVLQHHVRGLVRLEEPRHAHDVRMAEGGERARFHEEAVQPVLVEVLVLVGARRDRVVGGAVGEVLRQVFLDDHLGIEVHVGRGIGDAESPLPQHPVDAVLEQPEPVRKDGIGGRGLGRDRPARLVGRHFRGARHPGGPRCGGACRQGRPIDDRRLQGEVVRVALRGFVGVENRLLAPVLRLLAHSSIPKGRRTDPGVPSDNLPQSRKTGRKSPKDRYLQR